MDRQSGKIYMEIDIPRFLRARLKVDRLSPA